MKITVNEYDFRQAWANSSRKDSFSYDGITALFTWLEELDNCSGTETELDIVGIDCDFTEYEDLEELQGNYTDIKSMKDLQDHTIVIPIEGTERFIIQNY